MLIQKLLLLLLLSLPCLTTHASFVTVQASDLWTAAESEELRQTIDESGADLIDFSLSHAFQMTGQLMLSQTPQEPTRQDAINVLKGYKQTMPHAALDTMRQEDITLFGLPGYRLTTHINGGSVLTHFLFEKQHIIVITLAQAGNSISPDSSGVKSYLDRIRMPPAAAPASLKDSPSQSSAYTISQTIGTATFWVLMALLALSFIRRQSKKSKAAQ